MRRWTYNRRCYPCPQAKKDKTAKEVPFEAFYPHTLESWNLFGTSYIPLNLFITNRFDAILFPEQAAPGDLTFQDKEEGDWSEADLENKRLFEEYAAWQQQVDKGRKISSDLNYRFSD